MAGIIYTLCALTAFLCAFLLFKAYRRGNRLLLWGGVCFAGLTVSNVLLVIDKLVLPDNIDLSTLRYALTLFAMLTLLYGLIWEKE